MPLRPAFRAAAAACGLVLVSSCNGFTPEVSAPLLPPSAYRLWWAETEACSGLRGDFERIRFEVVPGNDFACPSGRCAGRWEPPATIYLAERWMNSEMVVRHEMLHVLLGRPGHPDPPFQRGCGLTWDSWQASPTAAQAMVGHPHVE